MRLCPADCMLIKCPLYARWPAGNAVICGKGPRFGVSPRGRKICCRPSRSSALFLFRFMFLSCTLCLNFFSCTRLHKYITLIILAITRCCNQDSHSLIHDDKKINTGFCILMEERRKQLLPQELIEETVKEYVAL